MPTDPAVGTTVGLLSTAAPARAARWAGWMLISLSAAMTLFAALAPLPETVLAPFSLVPIDGTAPIQAPVQGRVTLVAVREGQSVAAGELLYTIRSDDVRELAARLSAMDEEHTALAHRISRRSSDHQHEIELLLAERALLERSLELHREHERTVATLLERKERAVDNGLLPGITLLDDRLLAADSTRQRVLAEQRLHQWGAQRQQRESTHERSQADDVAAMAGLAPQISALRAQLTGAEGDLQQVRAPYAGVVLGLAVPAAGAVVSTGQDLAQLARSEARVQARLHLSEADLSRLHPGQAVRLYLAAFPYQRHGSAPARVVWVSPAAGTTTQVSAFHALAELEVIPGAGPRPLPGMTGEARVLVARRTLLERALEPIRGLRDRLWLD